jgi:hypothetical protein
MLFLKCEIMKSTYIVKPILWLQIIDKQMGDMIESQFKRIKRKFEILIWFIILHKEKGNHPNPNES